MKYFELGNNQKRVLEYYQKINAEKIKLENEKFSKRIQKKYYITYKDRSRNK